MERTTSGHRAICGRTHRQGSSANCQGVQTSDRSRRVEAYSTFAGEIHRDLAPHGTLERLVAGLVIHNAWKLKVNLETQAARDRSERPDPAVSGSKNRIRPTELDRAAHSMREAIESLDYLKSRPGATLGLSLPKMQDEASLLSNEWTIVPVDTIEDDTELVVAESELEAVSWKDRLVFDFEVSDLSPVVQGTWITVSHVVSLIVDGWNWADILRSHPELTEDDIRTCVNYAMAEESSLG